MLNLRLLKLSDPAIWISAGCLIIISFLGIFSSTFRLLTKAGLDPFLYVEKQFIALLFASVGLIIFSYFDYKHFKKAAPYLYGLTLLLLLLIIVTGSSALGAQRWLQLGPIQFQPSEMSKLTMIISLALFLSIFKRRKGLWEVGWLALLVGIPFLLVFKQPDLGTAIVYFAIFVGMLAGSGYSTRLLIILTTPILSILLRPVLYLWIAYLLILALSLFLSRATVWDWILIFGTNVLVGLALPFIWGMLKGYQQQRIVAFINPAADPYGAGYHSMQSKIAIGSGGFFGKGFLNGSQTQLQFIPEQHSDFIFSVVGEEFGFLGSIFALAMYAVFIYRALFLSLQAPDSFGRLLCIGIASMIMFHVLANVGMALGILPVVGIPLPFMSFGGTSLLVNLCCVGILQNIAMRRQKIIF